MKIMITEYTNKLTCSIFRIAVKRAKLDQVFRGKVWQKTGCDWPHFIYNIKKFTF
jgi:hypothetical protein